MKKLFVSLIFVLTIGLSMISANAETLEENMNNLVGARQKYNIELNKNYLENNESDVSVNPQNGSVTMRQTDYHLNGINGLDVDITRIYRSDQTTFWEMKARRSGSTWVDYLESDWNSSDYYSFYEERYNLGVGTRFSFSSIEVKGEHKYLHYEDGNVYRLVGPTSIDGVQTYKLEGYKNNDMKVIEDNSSSPKYNLSEPIGKSKYILIDRNGLKTYFSGKGSSSSIKDEGRILGMVDRYGNEIRFEYQDYSYTTGGYTHTRRLISKIIDTVGREITIEYLQDQNYQLTVGSDGYSDGNLNNKFNTKIRLPDNSMIVYKKSSFQHHYSTKRSLKERIQWVNTLSNADDYGVDDYFGSSKYYYWFEQADCKFTHYNGTTYKTFYISGMGYMYNQWETLKYISYDSNKKKIFNFSDGTRNFGSGGTLKYRKVSEEIDLVDGDFNTETETYTGTPEKRLQYTYTGEPDGHYSGAKTYPLIDFEGDNDLSLFTSNTWSRSTEAAKDGKYGICSRTNYTQTSGKIYVNLNEPGILSFDMKVTNDEDGSLRIYVNDDWEPVRSWNTEWESRIVPLRKGSYYLEFRYTKESASTKQVFIDNITIGKIYNTEITDLQDPKGTVNKYTYNPQHQLVKLEQLGNDNYSIQFIKYNTKDLPEEKQYVSYDKENGVICDAPVEKIEKFTYDDYGNVLSHISPDSPDIKTEYTYGTPEQFFKLLSRTVKQGYSTVLEQTNYSIDSLGNTIQETRNHKENSVVKNLVTDFTYDTKGNMISKTSYSSDNPTSTFMTNYEYGAVGNYTNGGLYLSKEIKGSVNAPLEEKQYTYDFNTGLLLSQTLFNNESDSMTTQYEYDDEYRITLVKHPDNSYTRYGYYDYGYMDDKNPAVNIWGQNDDIVYSYDIRGNLTKVRRYSSQNCIEQNEYDCYQNLTKTIDGNGNSIRYAYDSANRLIKKSTWENDSTEKSSTTVSYTDKKEKIGYEIFDDVVKAVAGSAHYSILREDGTVWSIGSNWAGQLGDGTTTTRKVPVQVTGLNNVIDIAAGDYHTLALKSDGTVWSWGDNDYGSLGDGTNVDGRTARQVLNLTNVASIEAGYYSSFAVKSDGTAWSWGFNPWGQLGDNSQENRNTPVQVRNLTNVKKIISGDSHNTYALRTNGELWAWGSDPCNQYGGGYKLVPYKLTWISNIKDLEAGGQHVLVIKNDNTVWGWGWNEYGQVGDGSITSMINSPVKVTGISDVKEIKASSYHTVALKNDGTVWTWGAGFSGALGHGDELNYNIPKQVYGLNNISLVGAGDGRSLALESTGKLWIIGERDDYSTDVSYPINILKTIPSNPDNFVHSVTITDENGFKTTQYYDKADRMVGLETTPDNNTYYMTKYVYDVRGYKTKITDPRNYSTAFTYDDLGRLTQKKDALNNTTTYKYNALDLLIEKQEPGSKITLYEYDAAGRPVLEKTGTTGTINTSYTYKHYDSYDKSGNIRSLKQGYTTTGDAGRVMSSHNTYTYNSRNRLAEKYDWLYGDQYAYSYYEYNYAGDPTLEKRLDDNGYIQTSYSYDNLRRNTEKTTSAYYNNVNVGTEKIGYEYDSNNNVTVLKNYTNSSSYLATNYSYDYANRLIELKEPVGTGNSQRTSSLAYDNKGNLISKTLKLGNEDLTLSFEYDGLNRLVSETDASGSKKRYAYDANGNKTIETDGRYASQSLSSSTGTRYTYDALNRPTLIRFYNSGTYTTLENRTYDGRGNITGVKKGMATYYDKRVYNADDRLIKYTPANVAAKGSSYIGKEITYDGIGNVLSEKQYFSGSVSNTKSYEYYGNGLLKSITYPDSSTKESYEYDKTGVLYEKRTARNSGITKIFKTLFGSPYRTELPDGTSETTTHDLYLGLALVYVDRKNRRREYKYDKNKNCIENSFLYDSDESNQHWKTQKMSYDEWGNLLSSETYHTTKNTSGTILSDVSQGDKTNYTYNETFKNTRIYDMTGREKLFEYDLAGNVVTVKTKTSENIYDVRRYVYDGLNRVTKDITLIDANQLENSSDYSDDYEYTNKKQLATVYTYNYFNVATMKSPNGYITSYTYDASYNVTKVTKPHNNVINYTYDFAGNTTSEAIASGKTTNYTYDSMGRVSTQYQQSPNGVNMIWRKTYDLMGNVITESTPALYSLNQAYTYTYDVMNRLISKKNADDAVIELYAYDNADNVIKKVNANTYDETLSISEMDGDTYSYDSFDRLVSKTDCMGNVTGYEYDLFDNIIKVTDAKNQSTVYAYAIDNTLSQITYPDGGQVNYSYDKKGRKLSQIIKQSSGVSMTTSYTYTPFDTVYTVTDAANHTSANYYDGNGNVVKSVDRCGNAVLFAYNGNNLVTQKQTPIDIVNGEIRYCVENYTYNAAGDVITKTITGNNSGSRTTTYSYTNGFLTEVYTNAGKSTCYEYDNFGNAIKTVLLRNDSNDEDVTLTEYDKYDRTVSISKLLDTNSVEIPGKANVTNSSGEVVSKTEYAYDVLGNKILVKSSMAFADALNAGQYSTIYNYDELNRLSSAVTDYNNGDGIQQIITAYTYDVLGNKTAVTDAKGGVTEYSYDSMNRVTSVTNANDVTVSYAYDLTGNKISETRPSGTWTYEYDVMNRLTVIKNPSNTVVSKTIYDANGNITKKIDGNGYASASNDETRYGTIYAYNASNMLISTTMPEGGTTQYQYNVFGEITKVIDPLNKETLYGYDSAGNLTSVTDPLGNETVYTYDLAGNRLTSTDARGKSTSYAYSAFNMLVSTTDPAGNTTSYWYDLNGKVTKMLDRNGNTTTYSYNSLGLLTAMNVLISSDSEILPKNQISYSYDCMGNRIQMTDVSGTYTYGYDALQRLTTISKNAVTMLSYTYTDEDSVASVSYNDVMTNYTYDSSNRLISVRNGSTGADYTYDNSNNITEIAYVGGVKEILVYNKNNAVASVTNKKADNSIVSTYSYTYDLCGRQVSKTDSYGTTTYSYDAAGHVLQVNMPGKTSVFTYDAAGNRASLTEEYTSAKSLDSTIVDFVAENMLQYNCKVVSYSYSDCNELLSVSEKMYNDDTFVVEKSTNYSYDNNGNQYMTINSLAYPQAEESTSIELVTEGSVTSGYVSMTQCAFDGFNRLISISKIEGSDISTTSYMYNGDGLRTQKTVVSADSTEETTDYLYDGQYVVAESGDTTATYVRGLSYIAKIGVSNGIDYYLYNAHGDVTQLVNAAGTIRNQYDYDIFGETILSVEETENSIQYSGEFLDESAGLYYLRARFYNPTTGRFISEDSYKGDIKDPASLNLYTYCHNDPINFSDPSGHSSKPPAWLDWDGDGKVDTKEDMDRFDKNHDGIADWNQGKGKKEDYRNGGTGNGSYNGGSSYNPKSGADTVTNWSSLSDRNQSNINSAYNAWKGGYITQQQYMDNVKLNGGTLANYRPSGVTIAGGVVAPNGISDTTKKNVISQIAAKRGISFADAENIYTNDLMTGTLSNDPNGTFAYLTAEGVVLHEVNIFIGNDQIQTVFFADGRNYGGLREMVDTLQGTGSVSFDPATGIATFNITNQQTGVSTPYTVDVSTLNSTTPVNGMLLVNDRVMVGLRWLAERSGLEPTLSWWNEGNASYALIVPDMLQNPVHVRRAGNNVTFDVYYNATDGRSTPLTDAVGANLRMPSTTVPTTGAVIPGDYIVGYTPRVDSTGNPVLDPTTGVQLQDPITVPWEVIDRPFTDYVGLIEQGFKKWNGTYDIMLAGGSNSVPINVSTNIFTTQLYTGHDMLEVNVVDLVASGNIPGNSYAGRGSSWDLWNSAGEVFFVGQDKSMIFDVQFWDGSIRSNSNLINLATHELGHPMGIGDAYLGYTYTNSAGITITRDDLYTSIDPITGYYNNLTNEGASMALSPLNDIMKNNNNSAARITNQNILMILNAARYNQWQEYSMYDVNSTTRTRMPVQTP